MRLWFAGRAVDGSDGMPNVFFGQKDCCTLVGCVTDANCSCSLEAPVARNV